MKKLILFLNLIIFSLLLNAQNKISGVVVDEQNSNLLAGASVVIVETNTVAISENDGTYIIKNLTEGKYHIAVSFIGYKTDTTLISIGKKSDKYIRTRLVKDSVDISEVTIIASRTEKGSRAPASIDIITKKQLQDMPSISVDDALILVSGLNASRNYGIYNKTGDITLRGLNRNIHSLILLDGVPFSLFDGSANLWNKLNSDFIDDIEIVKGPNSALYGSNAMAGVININSIKAQKPFEAFAKVFFGTYNTQGGALSFRGSETKNDKGFYWGTNGFFRKSGGYVMAPDSLRDSNDVRTYLLEYNISAKAGYKFSKEHTIEAEYLYSSDKRGNGSKFYENEGSFNQYFTHFLRIAYNRTTQKSEIHLNGFFKKEFYNKQNESVKSSGAYTFYNTNSDSQDEGMWFTYTSKHLKYNLITAGADFKMGRTLSDDIYHTSTDTIVNNGKMDFTGIFIQDQLNFLKDKLIVVAALRGDMVRFYKGEFHIFSPTLATSFLTAYQDDFGKKTWFAISPKLGLKYIYNDNYNIYANYNWGFRPPNISDLARTGDVNKGFKLANPELKPEKIQSLEIGAGIRPAKWIMMQPVFFYSIGNDFQYFVATGDSVYTSGTNKKAVIKRQNVGRVDILGFEFKTKINFRKNICLFASYSFNSSKIGKYENDADTSKDLTGNYLIEVPKNLASAAFVWNNRILSTTITGKFIDKEWVDDENTLELDSYFTFDVKIQHLFYNKINCALTAQNILNKRFVDSKGLLSPGRYFLMEVSFNW